MANQMSRQVKQAVPEGDWLETFGRIGYAAKGVVYTVVGILALQAALGPGGETTGARGAIRELAVQPFGQVLLVLAALGLVCYGIWRLVLAALDPRREGNDAEGLVKRVGYAGSGLVNLVLAFFAAQLVFSAGGGGGGSEQQMAARVMSKPFGLWLVGAVGAVILAVGLYHFYRAYNATFMQKYSMEMSAQKRRLARRIGQVGMSARGVAFSMIGIFFIQAAIQQDPSEAGGLDRALAVLISQPYGPWLLGAVAAGFICYGIYCFSYTRYRYFHTQTRIS